MKFLGYKNAPISRHFPTLQTSTKAGEKEPCVGCKGDCMGETQTLAVCYF